VARRDCLLQLEPEYCVTAVPAVRTALAALAAPYDPYVTFLALTRTTVAELALDVSREKELPTTSPLHVAPPFVLVWYVNSVIVRPLAFALNAHVAVLQPSVRVAVGDSGTPYGCVVSVDVSRNTFDSAPEPALFTARIFT